MENVIIKWNGVDTKIWTKRNEVKSEVKHGDIIELGKREAKELLAVYKGSCEILDKKPEPEIKKTFKKSFSKK